MKTGFAGRLKDLRRRSGFTQLQLASELSLQRYNISDWEQGRTEPSIFNIIMIAGFFGVTTDFLLGVEDDALASADAAK